MAFSGLMAQNWVFLKYISLSESWISMRLTIQNYYFTIQWKSCHIRKNVLLGSEVIVDLYYYLHPVSIILIDNVYSVSILRRFSKFSGFDFLFSFFFQLLTMASSILFGVRCTDVGMWKWNNFLLLLLAKVDISVFRNINLSFNLYSRDPHLKNKFQLLSQILQFILTVCTIVWI